MSKALSGAKHPAAGSGTASDPLQGMSMGGGALPHRLPPPRKTCPNGGLWGNNLFIVLCTHYVVTFGICNSQRGQGGTEHVKAAHNRLCLARFRSDPEKILHAGLSPLQLTACASFTYLPLNVTVLI